MSWAGEGFCFTEAVWIVSAASIAGSAMLDKLFSAVFETIGAAVVGGGGRTLDDVGLSTAGQNPLTPGRSVMRDNTHYIRCPSGLRLPLSLSSPPFRRIPDFFLSFSLFSLSSPSSVYLPISVSLIPQFSSITSILTYTRSILSKWLLTRCCAWRTLSLVSNKQICLFEP